MSNQYTDLSAKEPLVQDASKRDFLKLTTSVGVSTGMGMSLGFFLPSVKAANAVSAPAQKVNAWIEIQPDESIIIRYARAEMGQGSSTSAPMLVAEELEADWKKVIIQYSTAEENLAQKRVYGDMASVGSRTIRDSNEYLRKAGATAREMLILAGANAMNVPSSECIAKLGVVYHTSSKKSMTYGQLALAASQLTPPTNVALKDSKDWKIIGQPIKRREIPDIVRAKIRYGIDTQLPGMVYAAVAACPVFNGTVKSLDSSKIDNRRGIKKVLNMGNFVAVVADNWWRAKEALKDVSIEWDVPEKNAKISSPSLMEYFKEGLTQSGVAVARNDGDTLAALSAAGSKVIESEYFTPYLAHSTMEPMVYTGWLQGDKLDIWTSTQNAEATLAASAAAAEVKQENVKVHPVQLGGGLGRRGTQDYSVQGAKIARAMSPLPVKLLWTREEDTQHDFYRPASLIKFRAAMDDAGQINALHIRVSAPSILSTLVKLPLQGGVDPQAVACLRDHPYANPNSLVEYAQRDSNVPVGFWRSVGHSQNPFMRESFIDELAHAAQKDPLEFRLANLSEKRPKDKAILLAVTKAANYGAPLPKGVFRGIAETEGYGSYTACVCEVSVNAQLQIKIHRIVVGIDPGYAVNPDNIQAQLQGSMVHGLSAIFWGEITVKDGRVEQSNFHDYRMMRLNEMPKVETVIAPTGGFWGGVGEPAQAPLGPALANAIFNATGKRVRSFPLKNHGFTLVKA
jgi:isoquinoline 1-oxidoreductase beta subunit